MDSVLVFVFDGPDKCLARNIYRITLLGCLVLVLLNGKGVREALVGILSAQDVLVFPGMPDAIFPGKGLRTDVPVDLHFAETQDRIGAVPDHSESNYIRLINCSYYQGVLLTWSPNWRPCRPPSSDPR